MARLRIQQSEAETETIEEVLLVEVRNRFDGAWSHGFAIVDTVDNPEGVPRYRLRRLSDGRILPALFSADELIARPADELIARPAGER